MSSPPTKLVGPIYHDSAYTHDFGDAATWHSVPGLGASSWSLQPPPGYAYKIVGCETKASADANIHSPLEIWFQAKRKSLAWGTIPPTGMNGFAYRVAYNSMKDWIKRATDLPTVRTLTGSTEITKSLLLFSFAFSPAPILWSSTGYANGMPKWNRMIIQVADHLPYKNLAGEAIEMALAKYIIEIYKEEPL